MDAPPKTTALETLLKKDRLIIIISLVFISIICWFYIIYLYKQMHPMNMDAFLFAMPMSPEWTATDFLLLFLMWLVMMIAMMTPSIAPLVLIFAMVNRQKKQQQAPFVSATYLFAGYYVAWAIFGLLATLLQWRLQAIDWLDPEMFITHKYVAGCILLLAGIFQFTTLKTRCLQHCATPVAFIHSKWKDGRSGAFQMGIQNGIYCLGCCWILMIVLFVAGIMNLLWIAIIGAFVLVEKIYPGRKWLSMLAGILLVGCGIYRFLN
jgi:predicted metal-binding membrane protein